MRILFFNLRRGPSNSILKFPEWEAGIKPEFSTGMAKLALSSFKPLSSIPPRSFLYGMSLFSDYGHEVAYRTQIPDLSFLQNFDLLIVHASMCGHVEEKEALTYIRRFVPEIRVLAVGPFAAKFPELFLESEHLESSAIEFLADAVVMDKAPEGAFYSLAKREIDPKKMPKRFPCFRWQNIEKLPYPEWEKFSLPVEGPFSLSDGPYYPLYASSEDLENVESVEKNERTPQELIKEIGHHYLNSGFRHFQLFFPQALKNVEQLREFSRLLRALGSKLKTSFHWVLYAREVNPLPEKLIVEMRVAGLKHIHLLTNENCDERVCPLPEIRDSQGKLTFSKRYVFGHPKDTSEKAWERLEKAKKENPFFPFFQLYIPKLEHLSIQFAPPWERMTGYHHLPGVHPWSGNLSSQLLKKSYRNYFVRGAWLKSSVPELLERRIGSR